MRRRRKAHRKHRKKGRVYVKPHTIRRHGKHIHVRGYYRRR